MRFPAALKAAAGRCEAKRSAVEAALSALCGTRVSFTLALDAAPANGAAAGPSAGGDRGQPDASRPEPVDPEDIADPFVRRAVDLFEARSITTQPLPPRSPRRPTDAAALQFP